MTKVKRGEICVEGEQKNTKYLNRIQIQQQIKNWDRGRLEQKSGRWTYAEEWGDKQNFAVDVCGQLLLTYKKIFIGLETRPEWVSEKEREWRYERRGKEALFFLP